MTIGAAPRFWALRGAPVELTPQGYLPDPEHDFERHYNVETGPLSVHLTKTCLILLGEPGAGKTTVARRLLDPRESAGADQIWINLAEYGSEDRLVRTVFQDNRILSDWINSDRMLTISFDSFDECLLRIETLAPMLVAELERIPTERLHVRFISRPAVWPSYLEQELHRIWEDTEALELLPLRRIDVASAATAAGIDSNLFLQEIDQWGLQPLAIRPITLRFLLEAFSSGTSIDATRLELYHRGCVGMCQEPSSTRRASRRTGRLTAQQRLEVASRIAALLLLCRRTHIMHHDVDTGVSTGLTPSEICVGTESAAGVDIQVNLDTLAEVLDTALFVSAGEDASTFSHRSHAEFLAARYLLTRRLSETQLLSLLCHHERNHRLIPQLAGVAAWLGWMDRSFLRLLVELDPQRALESGLECQDNDTKAFAAETLLEACAARRVLDDDVASRRHYASLSHPGLPQQLHPHVANRDAYFVLRRVAIDIAEECNIRELGTVLAGVALDRSEPTPIRAQALHALIRIADSTIQTTLLPLVDTTREEDPQDELFGDALRILFPKYISSGRLFEILRHPRYPSLVGSYSYFLLKLPPSLRREDIEPALEWTTAQPSSWSLERHLAELLRGILQRAWDLARSDPTLEPSFARAALSRLQQHEDVFATRHDGGEAIELSQEDRRRIVWLLAREITLDVQLPNLVWSADLVEADDIFWLIERYEVATSEPERMHFLEAIHEAVRLGGVIDVFDRVDAVIQLAFRNAEAQQGLAVLLDPVLVDSPIATAGREHIRQRAELDALIERGRSPRPTFSRSETLAYRLERLRRGERTAWPWIAVTLIADSETGQYSDLDVDIADSEGWRELDLSVRREILDAAEQFLQGDAPSEGWSVSGGIPGEAIAGYRAISLLADAEPPRLHAIGRATLARWAESVVCYQFVGDGRASDRHRALLAFFYRETPSEFLSCLRLLFLHDRRPAGRCFFVRHLRELWDSQLARAVISELRDPATPDGALEIVLDELLEANAPGADIYALSVAGNEYPHSSAPTRRSIIAATQLLVHQPGSSFQAVWPLLLQNREFGRAVIESIADHHHGDSFTTELAPNDAASVFVWIIREYPPETDPVNHGVHQVGPRESVAMLRRRIIAELRQRGSREAYDAIRWIRQELPHRENLIWDEVEAERAMLVNTWIPPSASEILQLAEDRRRRLVHSGSELLDVVLEAIDGVQEDLQGATAEALLLWDERRSDTGSRDRRPADRRFFPREENTLSDYIKNRLEQRLSSRSIVVNREVEIRKGSETDIHVEASSSRPEEPIVRVTIEVKGCWNEELRTAMQTQLRDRYLLAGHSRHGIYLVGWYLCDPWSDDHYQKVDTRRLGWTMQNAVDYLEQQASTLSGDSITIRAVVLDIRL